VGDAVKTDESGTSMSPSNPDMPSHTDIKVISVNVGLPREVAVNGGIVSTGIFKHAVSGAIRVERLNLVGDRQADLSVHGGPYKAVYAYPSEHYDYWRRELAEDDLPWGMFGENLTTEGLHETAVNIGDRYRFGTAELVITQPRSPCYKLGIRFGRPEMVKRFLHSGRSGFYFAVAQEGEVKAGDSIELLSRDANSLSVFDINKLYASEKNDREMLLRASRLQALPESWRGYFLERLERIAG
jgi:MOSC domain-containing protein YiiM